MTSLFALKFRKILNDLKRRPEDAARELNIPSEEINKIIITRPVVTVEEEIGFLPGNIIKKMEDNRRKYIDKLKKEIVITDKKSNEYATNVSASILLELFIKKLGDNIQKDDFVKSIKKLQNNKLDKDLIKNIAKQFNSLFSDKDAIKRINIKKHKITLQ